MTSAALASPAERALFSAVRTADAATAVVQRLRAAVGLGLLEDGDKLPREADLARQLGVTTFALREALGVLREDGVIVTRPGKNGGSFVCRAPDPTDSARVRLLALSSTQLRDLGDARRMLTSHVAALAARRASSSSIERLSGLAAQVGDAPSAEQARRAYGRFHLELAAAAQSTRLTQAELAMHEEFDWLVTKILEDDRTRADIAAGFRAITDAVRSYDTELAREAAAEQVDAAVRQLVRLRLAYLASAAGGALARRDGPDREAGDLHDEVHRLTLHLLSVLDALAHDVAPHLAEPSVLLDHYVSQAVVSRTGDIRVPFDGLGVIAEPATVTGHAYWMHWWHRGETGLLERDTHHGMDPKQDDFYDYQDRDFIAHPRQHRRPWAMGPYVDYDCVDDYLITLSTPVVHDGRFLGVAALDLLVADVERHLAPWLVEPDPVIVLMNAEFRVIASNSVAHSVGDVVRDSGSLKVITVEPFGWALGTTARAGRTVGQSVLKRLRRRTAGPGLGAPEDRAPDVLSVWG